MGMPRSVNARRFYRAAMQRLDDSRFLLVPARTTAAVYLAGYSVECILKALVLSVVPDAQENDILAMFRSARAHDYGWLRRLYLENGGSGVPPDVIHDFVRVTTWATDMRYSPGTIKAREAKAFVDSATKIIQWADRRL